MKSTDIATKRAVLEILVADPSTTSSSIGAQLGIPWRAVNIHLDWLRKRELIDWRYERGRRVFVVPSELPDIDAVAWCPLCQCPYAGHVRCRGCTVCVLAQRTLSGSRT